MTWRRAVGAAACAAIGLAAACSANADRASEPRETPSTRPAATTTTVAPTTTSTEPPLDGAPGAGDAYFPQSGNGGYDVARYTLDLAYDPATDRLDGTALVSAVATEPLRSFDLDLHGMDVTSVAIDGRPVTWARTGDELTITPAEPIGRDEQFSVVVAYGGVPSAVEDPQLGSIGWISTDAGSYAAGEPLGSLSWFPCNDHPSDKAAFTFVITVPAGFEVVANGRLVAQPPAGSAGAWMWAMDKPMATYLAEVSVGDYVFVQTTSPAGVPIRDAFPPGIAERASYDFGRVGEMVDFFATQFGPYPFEEYGALVADADFGFALETQGRSLFPRSIVDGRRGKEIVVAHELAHQWFGDSVTPSQWQDVWLNEGFATYAEWLWTEHDGGVTAAVSAARTRDQMAGDSRLALPPPGAPGSGELFAPSVYLRGALTLEALRLAVGDGAFFATLRRWVIERGGGNGSTADFVAIANKVAGRPLDDLFDAWLLEPPLPLLDLGP